MLYKPDNIPTVDDNIESKMTITVAFPDNSLNQLNGGFDSIQDFKVLIQNTKLGEKQVELRLPNGEFVKDYDDSNFISMFPDVFLYGIGGPSDLRLMGKNGTGEMNFTEYARHISSLAGNQFHKPLLSLVLYNMNVRRKVLKHSYIQLTRKIRIQDMMANTTFNQV